MAHKVIDVTRYRDHYDELSKTPKNHAEDNYYLKELQDKLDAEWELRPNRVDIEYEAVRATMERAAEKHVGDDKSIWKPIEVVIQSVRSEKGAAISDDCRKIVFRNIREDRFGIGSKFRFAPGYVPFGDQVMGQDLQSHPALEGLDFDYEVIVDDPDDFPDESQSKVYAGDTDSTKNVWLAINTNTVNMTSNMIIERCNGVLGSVYVDHQNIAHYHYEPVIQGKDLTGTNFAYNDIAITPQGTITVIAQHNDFTSAYRLNQRFIIGYNQVFRITAINNFYSNFTFDPHSVGLIKFDMVHEEISEFDNFEKLIAYQFDQETIVDPIDGESSSPEFSFVFDKPDSFPKMLKSKEITFQPVLKDKGGQIIGGIPVYVDLSLGNMLPNDSIDNYIVSTELSPTDEEFRYIITNGANIFSLKRRRMYLNGTLNVRCYILPKDSPTKGRLELAFSLSLDED